MCKHRGYDQAHTYIKAVATIGDFHADPQLIRLKDPQT